MKIREKLFSYLGLLVILGSFVTTPIVSVAAIGQDTPSAASASSSSVVTNKSNEDSSSTDTAAATQAASSKSGSSTEASVTRASAFGVSPLSSVLSTVIQPRAPSTPPVKSLPTDQIALTITGETITDASGNPITQVNQDTSFNLQIDFSLPNNTASAGDQSTIKLPDSLKVNSDMTFEVKNGSGDKIADAYLDAATKTITLSYTDYVQSHSDITGMVYVGVKVDTSVVTSSTTIPIDLLVNGTTTYNGDHLNYGVVQDDTTEQFAKNAWFDSNNQQVINYSLRVNVSGKSYTDATIKDTLESAGITYDKDTIKIQKGTWALDSNGHLELTNAQDVTGNYTIDMKSDNSGFSIGLGDISAADGFNITYQVKINHAPLSGEVFNNDAVMTGNNTTIRDTPVSTAYQTAGGEANGYNYTIKVHKIDHDNNSLADAEFTVYRDSTGEAVGTITTDNTGMASVSGLLRDNYTIKETRAPVGYEISTQDIKVNDSDFGADKSVLKEVSDQKQTTEVSGTKTWDDSDNQDGVRPDSITVNLLADGQKVDSKTVTASDDWKYSFTNLDKYKDGQEINYTVTEDAVKGYSTTYDGDNITNSYTPGKTSITVTKAWDDNDNQDGIRPDSIQVQLYANDEKSGDPVTVTAGDDWTYTWDNLALKKAGKAISYTVKEVGTVTGYTTATKTSDGNVVLTNSHTPETTEISGTKTWSDSDNQDGIRPDSITVNLLANGQKVESKTVTASDDWQYSFNDLAKYKDGKAITYTVTEDAVADYSTTYDGNNIINSYTPGKTSITVTKAWDDNNNQDGLRPTSIQVQLYADGVKSGDPVTVAAGDDWTHTWNNLPLKKNGQTITYTVKEVDAVTGYTESTTTSNGNVVLTNSHTPATTQVTGTKTWADSDNQDGLRPDSITVNLLADGQKVDSKTVTASDDWQYSFTNLAQYKDGKAIAYTVSEDPVKDYSTTYDGSNITNSYTPGKTSITVTKAWNDNSNQDGLRPASIQVQLYADDEKAGDPVTVTADDNWTYTWDNLAQKKSGKTITYTVKEVGTVKGYTEATTTSDGNVVLTNSHTPETTTVSGKKTWDDSDNQDGVRPDSITVNLLADGQKVASKTVTASDDWKYSFDDLAKFKDGKAITYTVTEDTVADYSTTYDGDDITNSYTPGKTSMTVTKAWNDNNNQDGLRPSSIQVQLYADGVKTGDPVTVSADDDWTYTWDNMAQKKAGKAIAYTVQEVGTVAGYTEATTTSDGNTVLTNSHTPETTEISGTKTWSDSDNQDGVRPDSITVNLLADGKEVASKTVTASDNWQYSFTNLDKFKDGKAIAYTVTEDAVKDYATTYDGDNITNSYTPGKTSITVTKAWADNNNQDGLRPASIQVQLYADGEKSGDPVTVAAGDNWTYTWDNLALKKSGKAITYTVKEVGTVTGYKESTTTSDGNVVLTNSHTPETTNVSGTKTWNDSDNQDGVRPDSITVNLLADGQKVASKTVTASDDWKYSFDDLAKFKDGKAITYTVTEDAVTNYSTTYDGDNITNSYTPGKTNITVTKAWADNNNQDGLRPASIQVQLYADGVKAGDPVTVTAGDNWTYTWDNLAQKKSGQTIAYTVKEVSAVNGYTEATTASDGNVVLTNSHTPETTEISGTKTWDDSDNQDGVRPDSITVNLLADGQKVASKTVSASDNWQYSFTNLAKFKDGQPITYTVTEDAVKNYSTTYDGMNIKNSYTPGKTNITVTKAWNDNNNQDGLRPASIQVQLYADGEKSGAPVTVTAGDNWTYTWDNLAQKKSGKAITYTVKEVGTVAGYTEATTTSDGNVVLTNSHTPATTQITGTKTWNDSDNQDGVRPASITVNLLADGQKVASKTVTASDNWQYSFTNLAKFKDGQAITYSVTEDAVKSYSTTYDGNNITNSYTPGKTNITVTKAWNDNNNQDGLRPASIQVQLYADGEKSGDPVTVTSGDNWTYTWNNLPLKKSGQTIVYTAKEVGTVAGYTEATTVSDGNVVLTNSHTPAITTITGTKTWNDSDNQDGIRPESITVNLLADGQKIASKTVTASDNWQYSFTNLAKFADGKAITYTVTEDAVKDYSTTYDGTNIKNSYTPGKTSITVTKAWNDSNNEAGLRPASIQVQLYANGEKSGNPVKVSAADNWTYTWDNLALKQAGKTITYTVKEVGTTTGYTSAVGSNDNGNINITNTLVTGKVILTKKDAKNGDTLQNAVFELQNSKGKVIRTNLVTNAQGQLEVDGLVPGEYQFVETTAPAGYDKDTTPVKFTIVPNQESAVNVVKKDKQTPGILIVEKVDQDTGKKLAGATFKLLDADGNVVLKNMVTDVNGRLVIKNLEPGQYKLIETDAPKGYILDATPIKVTIKMAQKDAVTVEKKNEEKPHTVRVEKVDGETDQLLPGAVFELKNAAGEVIKTGLTTDANGTLAITDLKMGNYTLVETKAPTGYKLDQHAYPFTISADSELQTLRIANYAIKTPNKPNTPKPHTSTYLPKTGEQINTMFIMLGLVLLIVIGSIAVYHIRRAS